MNYKPIKNPPDHKQENRISKMIRPKNIQFTNLIKAGGQLHEFNFRKSESAEGHLYTVDVADKNGSRHYIIFRLTDKNWVLKTKNIPAWIEDVIPQIQLAIDTRGNTE
jgi:hypothetical protein